VLDDLLGEAFPILPARPQRRTTRVPNVRFSALVAFEDVVVDLLVDLLPKENADHT
jgi:hypothetical protein